ncbi:DNA-methyltransferase [Helicobacter ailurogastricus]|uniref:Methyltransferase n=1 Tax=Helicobacter ailurogastricus TaxID=1578720 RepID=A0A0K2XC52_9HELI|nr:site-specific DNA-methyltransferase [Helicobacter ailurogastricus]CRF40746.1 adenine specific DNA methyltransferase (HINFIM) [Helicobacter ailurogastricus]CRF42452.1 adenine specific DNA methyltransferase (HINFIM) [Helicobacter ailurogastricus]CRF43646.1 adenine specific DNA methyltransferase (HINFIM) [Helicobacter ailurogastricus]
MQNTILQGDCATILTTLPSGSVDFIFADPPYFMQTQGELLRVGGAKFAGVAEEWDKFKDFTHYDSFSQAWLAECRRVLKTNGSICVIGSFQNIYRLGALMQDLGFWMINDIIWAKSNPVPNFNGTRLCNAHETLLWCAKDKKASFTFNYKTLKALNGGKQEKSIWEIPLCVGAERLKDSKGQKLHPTQKPERLLEKLLLMATKPGDLVLDPFVGTGTTGAVAKRLGRNFLGIEKDSHYIRAALARITSTPIKMDAFSRLECEKKPPKVPMKTLVDSGYLFVGQALCSPSGVEQCQILPSGQVQDSSGAVLSIHKMSAKLLNKINHNGWDYFYTHHKGQFIPLNDLRYLYAEGNNAKC